MLSDDLRRRIQSGAEPTRPRRAIRYRRTLLTVVAACLTLAFGIGAAAAAFSYYERFISRMGEDVRGLVQPLGQVSQAQGIQMEVLAAVHNGDTAIIYLALTDEKSHRIDEGTELLHIDMGDGIMAHAVQVDYDTETATAVFKVESNSFGDTHFGSKPVTLTVHSVLTGVTQHEGLATGLTVADIIAANPQPSLVYEAPSSGFGVNYGASEATASAMADAIDAATMPLLEHNSAPITTQNPAWATIGAAAVVDDLLHIQFQPDSTTGLYGYTDFYLSAPGTTDDTYMNLLANAEIRRGATTEVGPRSFPEYLEQIIELPAGVAYEDLAISVRGQSCTARIDGGWQATFTLDDKPPQLTTADNLGIDLNGWTIDHITVSSIGASAKAHGQQTGDSAMLDMQVYLKDGTQVGTHSVSISGSSDDAIFSKISFTRPIDLREVDRLLVNGVPIPLHPQSPE